jgi:hypothetical protein
MRMARGRKKGEHGRCTYCREEAHTKATCPKLQAVYEAPPLGSRGLTPRAVRRVLALAEEMSYSSSHMLHQDREDDSGEIVTLGRDPRILADIKAMRRHFGV